MSDIEVSIEQSLEHIIEGEIVRGSGASDYNELENKPSINGIELSGDLTTADLGIKIPTKTSELENDSGYLTEHQSLAGYYTKDEIDNQIGDINSILDNINGEVI